MEDKITKSPNIRFVCFTDAWKHCKLSDISDKVTEKNTENNYDETLTNSAELGIVSQRDFFDKNISNSKNLAGYYVVKNDDFVYNPRISNHAPVGPIKRNKLGRSGVMSPLYYVFRTHHIDRTYLEHYFVSTSWHNFMKLNGDSGARADRFAIKDSVLREMPIPYPTLEEQAKVGELLDRLEGIINLHQNKLELLKVTKKSMIQKMFPIDGQSIPEIRFEGFTDAWKQYKLEQIADVFDGTHQTPKYTESGIKFVSVENIDTLETTKFISQGAYDKEYSKKQAEKGDILMTRIGDIGTARVIETEEPLAYYVTLALLKPKQVNSDFLASVISSDEVQRNIWKRTLHIAFPKKINLGEINEIELMIPSGDEQVKVGSFFKELDRLITFQKNELDLLKDFKKSLLQQMFI